ncbi:hypothetical protein DFQ28_001642 [Apophysomyces sp. BC1034]|nr:hypothetical protein DFQ29_001054 [Apophysomyces sp. BC1021]KAG0190754.1 hypothetical protein DFQ28_001642 [Apophysomyces sp. BC1034]
MSLTKSNGGHSEVVRLLYQISKENFEQLGDVQQETLYALLDTYRQMKVQLKKIMNAVDNSPQQSADVRMYTEEAYDFIDNQLQKYQGRVSTATEYTILSNPDEDSYIENFMQHCKGRMRWTECYLAGRKEGLFLTYKSSSTLKSAYHNEKSKARKRKCIEKE